MKREEQKENEINGSGLFFFKSKLTVDEKFEMLEWYNGLAKKEQSYVDALRKESSDESEYFNQD